MRTIFFLIAIVTSVAAFALPNDKVLNNFKKTFPNADSVQWSEGKEEYNVYFINDGVRCRAWYDEDGNVMKAIRYLDASMLPPMVAGNVRKKYPGLRIYGVTEYAAQDEFYYQLMLEGDKKWYTVNSDAVGNLTMINKLNKAGD